ncbi:anti-sigma factor family protein [Actinomadura hibisca]|uniref:anti-sigma factor family protein n=1 Tax=Actinomadura hibisca TaxID=68565 RepID=UPI00082ED659|nr:zf-HC2 domain-containing protein [Actinomadura hibisca]
MTAGSASIGRHIEVASYALGLLEEPDRAAFERHLPGCPACRGELAELRGLAEVLEGMPLIEPVPPPAGPDPAAVGDLLRRRARRERRGRTARALLGAAAGVVLLAGALGVGVTLGADRAEPDVPPPSDDAASVFRTGRQIAATDGRTGVAGQIAFEPKAWGSRVAMRLGKVRGPLECELVAVDENGRAHAVAGWAVPDKGYGLPGSPAPLTLQGGTALSPSQIAHFEVRTLGDGRTLLTIPA